MTKITIELEDEQVDAIVLKELKSLLKCIEKDFERYKKGKGYHHPDDVAKYPLEINALKLVSELYEVK